MLRAFANGVDRASRWSARHRPRSRALTSSPASRCKSRIGADADGHDDEIGREIAFRLSARAASTLPVAEDRGVVCAPSMTSMPLFIERRAAARPHPHRAGAPSAGPSDAQA